MGLAALFALGGVLFAALGVLFLARGRRESRALKRFRAVALTAQAQVLDLRRHRIRRYDAVDGFYFCPVVRFSLPDGRVVESETMRGSNPAPARVGQVVPVLYDPGRPTRVNLAQGRSAGSLSSCVTIGLAVGMIGFGLLFVAIGGGLAVLTSHS